MATMFKELHFRHIHYGTGMAHFFIKKFEMEIKLYIEGYSLRLLKYLNHLILMSYTMDTMSSTVASASAPVKSITSAEATATM